MSILPQQPSHCLEAHIIDDVQEMSKSTRNGFRTTCTDMSILPQQPSYCLEAHIIDDVQEMSKSTINGFRKVR